MTSVISKDGTSIVYDQKGNGPAVILVDGAFCSKDFGPMPKIVPLLSQKFRVISYDRRARGASGDTKPYAVEREIEDIEALIDMAGGTAFLFGISSGAILSIKAVAYGLNIDRLALLEPPFVGNVKQKRPSNSVEQLKQMISEGRKGDAVNFYLRKVMGMPVFITWILRLTPNWSKMKANANSLPYDATVCGDFNLPFKLINKKLTIPTIVIDSSKSPKMLREAVQSVAEILPNGQRITLSGAIHEVPPKILVPVLTDFYNK